MLTWSYSGAPKLHAYQEVDRAGVLGWVKNCKSVMHVTGGAHGDQGRGVVPRWPECTRSAYNKARAARSIRSGSSILRKLDSKFPSDNNKDSAGTETE